YDGVRLSDAGEAGNSAVYFATSDGDATVAWDEGAGAFDIDRRLVVHAAEGDFVSGRSYVNLDAEVHTESGVIEAGQNIRGVSSRLHLWLDGTADMEAGSYAVGAWHGARLVNTSLGGHRGRIIGLVANADGNVAAEMVGMVA